MPKTFNVQRCLVHTVRYRHYSTTPEPIIFDNDAEAKQQREELEKEAKLKKRKMWTWAAIGTVKHFPNYLTCFVVFSHWSELAILYLSVFKKAQ
jgi:hypothetical protein